jgi:RNA polymerase sigma-70 factor
MHLPSKSGVPAGHSPCTASLDAGRWQAFEDAREQWSELHATFEDFSAHLDQLGYRRDLPTHPGSLYLCIACGQGCDVACKLLETRYFPALRSHISKFDARPDVIEDLLQQVRFRLLVGTKPRIRSYRGRGSFDAWLREVARSVAIDSIRVDLSRDRRVRRCSQDAMCKEQVHAATPLAPDEHVFRQRYVHMVQHALIQSIQTLPRDRRQLLHHYYVSGLNIDQLGSLYSVNRSTAARRIQRSVRSIQRTLRKELTRHMGSPDSGELEGWVPILYRCWGVDLDGFLGARHPIA